jgi:hypothetical protein
MNEESSSDKNENNSLTRRITSANSSGYSKKGKFATIMARHMHKEDMKCDMKCDILEKKPRKLTDDSSDPYSFNRMTSHTPTYSATKLSAFSKMKSEGSEY